jgi:hypothetical protein
MQMNIDEIMDAAQYAADAQEGWVARDGTEMEELRSKIQSAIESAVINERESCAKLCEHLSLDGLTGLGYAEEIRKRSDAEESAIDDDVKITYQYYYKVDGCPAHEARDPNCICWHNEGTGPFPGERRNDFVHAKVWRTKADRAE